MKFKSPIANKNLSQTGARSPISHQTPSRSPLSKLSRLSQSSSPHQKNNNSREKTPESKTSDDVPEAVKNSKSIDRTPENRNKAPSLQHSDKKTKRLETTPIRVVPTRVKQLDKQSPTLFSSSQTTSSDSSLEQTKPPATPKQPKQSPHLDISDSFSSSFLFTPMKGGTQRHLYSTGLMSPYSSKSDETVRLGVPEEVFKLIDKIRGIKSLYPWQQKTVAACLRSGGRTLFDSLLVTVFFCLFFVC